MLKITDSTNFKKKGGEIIRGLLLAAVFALLATEGCEAFVSYARTERSRYMEAVAIIQEDALTNMAKADADGDIKRKQYFKWRYNNPDRVIKGMDGPNNVLKWKKAHQDDRPDRLKHGLSAR